MANPLAALVSRFEKVYATQMRELPISNPHLAVEVAGTRRLGDHTVCVLITPWFMNLVLLPGSDEWAEADPGESHDIVLPRESLQFCVSRDDRIGVFLSAVLFRSMSEFPDQDTARLVASEVLQELFAVAIVAQHDGGASTGKVISRRSLLIGLETS